VGPLLGASIVISSQKDGDGGAGWKSGILRNLKAQILSAPCPVPEGARDVPSKAVTEPKETKKTSKSGSFAVPFLPRTTKPSFVGFSHLSVPNRIEVRGSAKEEEGDMIDVLSGRSCGVVFS